MSFTLLLACSLDAISGKCFDFSSQFQTWADAVNDCQLKNGYLAIKVGKDERKFLNNLRGLKSIQETEFHVGLYKVCKCDIKYIIHL